MIFNREFNFFGSKKDSSGPETALDAAIDNHVEFESNPARNISDGVEVAISETSNFYSSGDFPKYNPDDLIGRKGFGIYNKMRRDEQIKASLKFKRDAITARGYTFQLDPKETGLSEEECQRRIKICETIIKKMNGSFMDSMHKILSAFHTGFSITEKVYADIEVDGLTYKGLRFLKLKPVDTFKFKVDEFGNIINIEQTVLGKIHDLDYDKFIHFVVNPDVDDHYGESELRSCYRAWFSKDVTIKLRNIFLERHAGGFHVLTPPPNKKISTGTPEHTSILNLLRNINVKTGVLLPSSDYKLEGQYPSSGGEIFEKTIDQCDLHIARALLVPNLLGITPSGNTGSFSQSQTQLDAFFWTLGNDAERLAETINEQLFKDLGELNFADGYCPEFKWNPLSKTKAIELIKLFTEMVEKRVLQSTPEDEDFIRSSLELPSVDALTEDEQEIGADGKVIAKGPDDVAATAMNGAQVQALRETLAAVSSGEIPKDTAAAAIKAAFPLLEDQQIQDMIDPLEEGSVENVDNEENENSDETEDDQDPENQGSEEEESDDENPDETIIGTSRAKIINAAFKKAESRVSFAVIDSNSEIIVADHIHKVTNITDSIVKDVIAEAKKGGDLDEDISKNTNLVKVDYKYKTVLKRAIAGVLKDSEEFGRKEAAKEIDKAMKEAFSMRANYSRMDMIANDYFEASSFRITGNISDEITRTIENEILNGARYGKAWDEVELAIYARLATKGMISLDLAKEKLAEDLEVKKPDARIRTVVRTSTFEAINTARDSYFTDPQLGDFVRAYEYSAILDDATTSICRHLDEDNAGDHSVDWWNANAGFKPPNHFNCRSLLVAVTVNDMPDFEEGPEPSIEPMEGFK